MLFKGRLRLPSDPGEGIPIDLELEDVILSLVSEGEDFGEWRLDKVEIRRLFSNQFALLLDGEEMVFVANDALGFAYDGLTFVEDVTGRLSKRRLFKGRKPSKRQSAAAESAPADLAEPASPEQDRVPDVVPFFPEPSQLGVPVADAPAAEAPAVEAQREPVGRQMSDLVSDEPEDAEVISMMHPIEVAPAMPAGEIIAEPFVPEIAEPAPVSEPARAPVSEPAPAPVSEPAPPPVSEPAPPPVSEPAPAPVSEPAPAARVEEIEEEEAELVIEDVAAYGYVPPVATSSAERDSSVPAPSPASQDEPVVEQVEAPAAQAPEIHPLGEVAAPDSPAPAVGESVAESAPIEDLADIEDEGPTIEVQVEDFDEEPVEVAASQPNPRDEVVPAPPTEEIKDFAWSSNGHAPSAEVADLAASNGVESSNGSVAAGPDDVPQTQKSGRHARSEGRSRSGSLFGRKKSREPQAHEHRYESSKTVGGITRSICSVCDHVSFAGEDVYQGW